MKRSLWLIIVLVIVYLSVFPLAGCGIPKGEHEALQADYDELQANYDAVVEELDAIKEVYPPRDFSSIRELEEWLQANDVSDRPVTEYADDWYRRALEIQEDALRDGYIVSADYDLMEDGESAVVWCVAIINGRAFFWDPETDEVAEESFFGTVK